MSHLRFAVLKHLKSLFYLSRIITQLTQVVAGHQVTQDLQKHKQNHQNTWIEVESVQDYSWNIHTNLWTTAQLWGLLCREGRAAKRLSWDAPRFWQRVSTFPFFSWKTAGRRPLSISPELRGEVMGKLVLQTRLWKLWGSIFTPA